MGFLLCPYGYVILLGYGIISKKETNMTNAKISKEERERIANEKRIARAIEYDAKHFYLKWFDSDKDGKPIEKHDALTGSYDETNKAVIFNIDMYNFTIAVDNHMGGIFLYSRCKTKEKSAKYYRNSIFAKDVRKDSKEFMAVVLEKATTIDALIEKAKVCKGFKENTREIVKDAIHMALGRATSVYNNHLKAEEKKQNETAKDKAVNE